ncbi:DUF2306 domain-containing protein [Frankia sp. AgPm24]|uniref:DUF2306 domain-containing protein n=1 Tax=Frankia umida TaxID=573489 RepID=A0ABT0JV74_9ACTN|nr:MULTISPECIES: DUF2306 domain-containing protein [Frankia]MCK9875450.1 DUF2306 domain-containing protein [Frankia umida]MCK9921832.1 DUF2306 domain-containing protein [Frankia sp. AgPm24]
MSALTSAPVPGRGRSWGRTAAVWWFALSAVAIAVFAPLPYLTTSLTTLAEQDSRLAPNYADRSTLIQAAFYLHIVFGGTALLLSPIQLSAWVRARARGLHRMAGRITLSAIVVAGTAGAVLSPVNVAGPIGVPGFGLLALLWMSFAVAAWRAIRRRDVPAHRRWAVRAFALTYAAVTLRLWLAVLIAAQAGLAGTSDDVAFDRAYYAVPFLCWVPNLLVAQWFLARRFRRNQIRMDEVPASDVSSSFLKRK